MAANYRRRRSYTGVIMFSLLAIAVLVSCAGVTFYMLGGADAFFAAVEKRPPMVQIPVNMRPVAAYNKVQRIDLLDPETGWIKFQEIPPTSVKGMSLTGVDVKGKRAEGRVVEVKEQQGQLTFVLSTGALVPHNQTDTLGGAIMNASAIVGRVVRNDKSAGLGFRESSFFPPGTPAGLAGATPPGMRSLTIPAEHLKGIHSLPAGARIDLMANVPLNELSSFNHGRNGGTPGASLVLSAKGSRSGGGQTEPLLLAQEALVLRPVHARIEPASPGPPKKPQMEVALALNPGDVIPLQSALNKDLQIICVAHSMQKTSEPKTPVAPTGPSAPVTSRAILAYNVITGSYFEDAATRQVRQEPVTAEQIKQLGIITGLDQLLGAVVKHDIPQGSFITKSDLLRAPQSAPDGSRLEALEDGGDLSTSAEKSGDALYIVSQPAETDGDAATAPPSEPEFEEDKTSPSDLGEPAGGSDTPAAPDGSKQRPLPAIVGEIPGISKFTPLGYKAVAIPWNKLYGSEYLQIDDVVDLTVSYKLGYESNVKEQERKPDGTVIDRTFNRRAAEPTQRTYGESLGFRGEPWYAAINAKVIGPVGFPPPAAATRFLRDSLFKADGAGASGKPTGPPIIFAVEEKDHEAVVAALVTDSAQFSVLVHGSQTGEKAPEGWKRIVLAAAGLPAFERLTVAELQQQHTRRLLTRLVREKDPAFTGAMAESELRTFVGRVLREYKPRHAFFTTDDFYPADVQPGFTGALSSDSVVTISATGDVEGLDRFRDGDLVAIMLQGRTTAPSGVISHGVNFEREVADVVVQQAQILRSAQQEEIVMKLAIADIARFNAARGKAKRDATWQLVAIALPKPKQATPNPAAPVASTVIPGHDPLPAVHVMETIQGDRRSTHAFSQDDLQPYYRKTVQVKETP